MVRIEKLPKPLGCTYCGKRKIRTIIHKRKHSYYKCDACGREILATGAWISEIGRKKVKGR